MALPRSGDRLPRRGGAFFFAALLYLIPARFTTGPLLALPRPKTPPASTSAEVADLRARLVRFEGENLRLQDALAGATLFRRTEPHRSDDVLVPVTFAGAPESGGFSATAVVDAGARDGIAPGMAVITGNSVVGEVLLTPAASGRSLVRLATDPSFRVRCVLRRSRTEAVAAGKEGRTMRLLYVPQGADVAVGDWLVTSSAGTRFPAGLAVGKVTRVICRAWEPFLDVEIEPAAVPGQVEWAFVVIPARMEKP